MPERSLILYLPIATTLLTVLFAASIYRRYLQRGRQCNHLLWWTFGVITYGMGTFAESYITLLGWNPVIFKFWYIVGALMGGAPLATGTVWLLLSPRAALRWSVALVSVVTVAAVFVILSPIHVAGVDPYLPSGAALGWQWVRRFSPLINTYAVVFLIGGAGLSAWRFRREALAGGAGAPLAQDRFMGNLLIAVGAILPGIGGASSRAGHTEVLYITELVGIILIWLGYRFNIRKRPIAAPDQPAIAGPVS